MRSLEEAKSELTREMNVRTRCYDRWVTEGRLTSVDAKDRLDRINAALHYLSMFAQDSESGALTRVMATP